MNGSEHRWWELIFTGEDIEERSLDLYELGSSGGHLISPTQLKVYVDERSIAVADFLESAAQQGFVLLDKSPVVEENWNDMCAELWDPLTIGAVTITPVASVDIELPSSSDDHQFYTIPGTGFGTGHHATTATLIRWLQEEELFPAPPQNVLDLGTGSGILAVLAARLFKVGVLAVDIDDLALDNARDNVQLNGVNDQVQLTEGTAAIIEGSYDLIIANIYAEVLATIEEELQRLLNPGKLLFLSGIHEDKLEEMKRCYSSDSWQWLRCEVHDTWASAILTSN